MRLIAAIGLVLAPLMASSEETEFSVFGPDFEMYFDEFASAIQTETLADGTIVQSINSPGNVLLERREALDGTVTYRLNDNGQPAVNCTGMYVFFATAGARLCPQDHGVETMERLEAMSSAIVQFNYDNHYPTPNLTFDEYEHQFFRYFEESAEREFERGDLVCGDGQHRGVSTVLDWEDGIDELLSVPRLAAWTPCL